MEKIASRIGKELYKIEIKSTSGNVIISDEPVDKGGQNLGLNPKELLISALAACTNATLRMYADRKAWDLEEIKIEVELEQDDISKKTIINRKIEFFGTLSDEQKTRLLAIANACPVHKILSNPIEINTSLL